ncbi:uncharacterized protein LY89DRAFT_438540 [Mollisia scopiformis]|uniref:Uncharacterized protein n=1 Tax=Mollisia scopiformis TaxID=149040 RepID=A0A194XJF7_MOLSC|nr:uncharacterized protein LY89DRAFT_438540 [Mollisia scopiformis]KUJ20259.1 hypothetical protein LY89DRAFT_438540 [Mollisia scopiformis]
MPIKTINTNSREKTYEAVTTANKKQPGNSPNIPCQTRILRAPFSNAKPIRIESSRTTSKCKTPRVIKPKKGDKKI